jgi:hypothetical protein
METKAEVSAIAMYAWYMLVWIIVH